MATTITTWISRPEPVRDRETAPTNAASTDQQENSLAELLRQRIAQACSLRDTLTANIDEMRTARTLTTADDEHDPEGSTVSLDHARDAALLTQATQTLRELLEAEERLTNHTYGRCEKCGRPIPVERLAARPEARLCVTCAAQSLGSRSRRS